MSPQGEPNHENEKQDFRVDIPAHFSAVPFAGAVVAQEQTLAGNTSARERIRKRHFPNVLLTAHTGKQVRFYDDLIKDKIVVINFIYVKCDGVCPGITANLARLQNLLGARLGRDIFMYSVLGKEGTVVSTLKVGISPYGVAVTPSGIWVTNAGSDSISRR